jgi:CRISPR-associated protein Cas2
MFVLISYDIVDNKIRNKVMKFLKDYGTRVQQSVFECTIDTRMYSSIKRDLEGLIDREKDRVRFYSLCQGCMKKIEISGWGEVSEDEEFKLI